MKKMYYGIYEGKAEAHRMDGTERYMLTVSSAAETVDEALESITGETGGPCFGPADAPEWVKDFLAENLCGFDEMEPEDESGRVGHLAEEWGLDAEELEYLR